jgi:hypothetical protein
MNTNKLKNGSAEQQLPVQESVAPKQPQLLIGNKAAKDQNKKKHRSALTAAAVARSAVKHVSHSLTNKPGDFAHSGTNICYEN